MDIFKTEEMKQSTNYMKLKHLKSTINILDMGTIPNLSSSLEILISNIDEEIKQIEENSFSVKAFRNCKQLYQDIIEFFENLFYKYKPKILTDNLELFKELKSYLKTNNVIQSVLTYGKIEKFIVNNTKELNLTYSQEKQLLDLLIDILYSGGNINRREIPYKNFWGKFREFNPTVKITERTWHTRQRAKFRKLFPYYIWDNVKDKFILTSLNKEQRKEFKFRDRNNPINLFLNSDSKLIVAAKNYMKGNATNPIKNANQIYLSVTKFGNKNVIYVGKAKKSTRDRWGYGKPHLHSVYHYIVRTGKHEKPSQVTDLWTLYWGPDYQVVITLIDDIVKGKVDDTENTMQYFLEFNKEKFDIYRYTHDKLSYKNKGELPPNYKIGYDEIEKGFKV
jgi:hypothetical protein